MTTRACATSVLVLLTAAVVQQLAAASAAAALPTRPSDASITSAELAATLKQAMASADFAGVWDRSTNATAHASLNVDVSVLAFDHNSTAPIHASVLLTRDYPSGVVVAPSMAPGDDWSITNVDWRWWDYPRWDQPQSSGAWTAPASGQWFGRLTPDIPPPTGPDALTFMVPHPASSFKVMLGVGVMRCVQEGSLDLRDDASVDVGVFPDSTTHLVWHGSLGSALTAMLQVSDNAATTAVIAALHRSAMLPDRLMGIFRSLGLRTLMINNTLPGGHWGPVHDLRNRSSEYDTTGFFHETSWDMVRLMWLLDADAPVQASWHVSRATWEAFSTWQSAPGHFAAAATDRDRAGDVHGLTVPVTPASLMNDTSRRNLMGVLSGQAWHDTLSTTAICGRPTRRLGIPSLEPAKWIQPDGRVVVNDTGDVSTLTDDIFPCQKEAEVAFAHKTGLTYTFGSAVGSVVSLEGQHDRRYYIALFADAGTRFTDAGLAHISAEPCVDFSVCYTQKLPGVARAVDDLLAGKATPAV